MYILQRIPNGTHCIKKLKKKIATDSPLEAKSSYVIILFKSILVRFLGFVLRWEGE